ncbi:MAG: hypothetical protein ACXAEX_01760 [Promethearchaeota archaeon]|jgi:hypothetical protein
MEDLKDIHEKSQSDKKIFVLLSIPFLIVGCFLTLHLIDIFELPEYLSVICIGVYLFIILSFYKSFSLAIKKQEIKLTSLLNLVIYNYKNCKFCGRQLSIKEFFYKNKKLKIQKIVDIWNNDFYGLLCCGCFQKTAQKFWIKNKLRR